VVGDDYTPMWEMPSLSHYFVNEGLNFKNSFNAYLKEILAVDGSVIWKQVEETIVNVFRKNQKELIDESASYEQKENLFEMVRFDFIVSRDVERNLKVYLMEVNMSPNLSSGHFPPNKRLYEQVLYSLFSVTGIWFGQYLVNLQSDDDKAMVVDNGDLLVFGRNVCGPCKKNCRFSSLCSLCKSCLSDDMHDALVKTFTEYQSRRGMSRILPLIQGPIFQTDPSEESRLLEEIRKTEGTFKDHLLQLWLWKKCQLNQLWCS
jgi:tubulin monoglycylase TTLL15